MSNACSERCIIVYLPSKLPFKKIRLEVESLDFCFWQFWHSLKCSGCQINSMVSTLLFDSLRETLTISVRWLPPNSKPYRRVWTSTHVYKTPHLPKPYALYFAIVWILCWSRETILSPSVLFSAFTLSINKCRYTENEKMQTSIDLTIPIQVHIKFVC